MAINGAPTLDGTASPVLSSGTENAIDPAGIPVTDLLMGANDADGDTLGIAIVALDTGLGAWQYSSNGGTSWLTIRSDLINSATNELALLLGPTALLRLVPVGELNGTLAHAITFRAWDGGSGSEGQYMEVAASGGDTAFSGVSDTASVTVAAVNDAPSFAPPNGTGIYAIGVGSSHDYAFGTIVQSDGKIVVVGSTYNGSDFDVAVVRLLADGTLDSSFNDTGMTAVPVGSSDLGNGVTLQADGKILVAGTTEDGGEFDFVVVRLNADGSLDTSFNGSGKASVDVGSSFDEGFSVTVQLDGKILVGGHSSYDFAMVRLNADGSLDTSFNGSGKAVVPVGSWGHSRGYSIAVQADGKILVGGSAIDSDNNFAVVRLNTDGSLDTGFNDTGMALVLVGSYSDGVSLAVQADGKILMSGHTNDGSLSDFAVVRLNIDGSLDTSFNGTGKASVPVGNSYGVGMSLIVQPDGKIVVAGFTGNGSNNDFAVVRLNADGSLDTSFNGTGKALVPIGSSHDKGFSLSLQPDGKIVVAGSTDSGSDYDFAVVRLNADGTLDTGFNGSPASTLGGTVSYTEDAAAVTLDGSVAIYDPELAAADSYAGASMTLARNGGANAEDQFSARGNLSFVSGNAVLSGMTIGSVANSGGALAIVFNGNATQARVNEALSSIGYANASDSPPASVQIGWTFSDGNAGAQGMGGALTGGGTMFINITAVVDPRVVVQGTDGSELLQGTTADDEIHGGGGDDTLSPGGGDDWIDGGDGIDTLLLDGALSGLPGYAFDGATWTISSGGGTVQFVGIERVRFVDALVALDTEGPSEGSPGGKAWQVAALFRAAFGRLTDTTELGRWVAEADAAQSMAELAQRMIDHYAQGIATADLVAHVYLQLTGRAAGADIVSVYVPLVGPEGPYHTQGELLSMAACLPINTQDLGGFTGLPQILDPAWFL